MLKIVVGNDTYLIRPEIITDIKITRSKMGDEIKSIAIGTVNNDTYWSFEGKEAQQVYDQLYASMFFTQLDGMKMMWLSSIIRRNQIMLMFIPTCCICGGR